MNNGLSKCVCKVSLLTKSIEGICGACFGRIPEDKQSRAQTPTLNPFQDTDTQFSSFFSPNPFNKRTKILKMSSSSALTQNTHHKRSYTINKPQSNHEISSLFESQATMKSGFYPNKPLTDRKPSQELYQVDNENLIIKKHERALSSRVHKPRSNPFSQGGVGLSVDGFSPEKRFAFSECFHRGHGNSVNSVAFLKNKAFSAGSDYKIIAWPRLGNKYQYRCQDIKPLCTYRGHSHKIHALENFPNSLMVSSGQEGKLRLWNVSNNFKPVSSLNSGEHSTKSLQALSTNQLLTGSASGNIKIYDIDHRSLLRLYSENNSPVLSLASISHTTFMAGTQNGSVKLFDLRTPRQISSFSHTAPITSLLTSETNYFYSASDQLWVTFI